MSARGPLSRLAFYRHTSWSAPSIHTYFALLFGLAFRMRSAIGTPVKRAVETPADPQENPFDLRTTFCSFRLLPAQTSVTGYVTCWYSDIKSLSESLNGFSTSLLGRQTWYRNMALVTVLAPFNGEFPIGHITIPHVRYRSVISYVE